MPNKKHSIPGMAMKHRTTAERVGRNINLLIQRFDMDVQTVAAKSGLSLRGLNYIRTGERSPSIDSVEAIGRVFGLTSWHLLSPTLESDLENAEWLDRVRAVFNLTSPQGQQLLRSAVEAAESMPKAKKGNGQS